MNKILSTVMVVIGILICDIVMADDSKYLIGKSELGTEVKLKKSDWPIVYRCSYYGGTNAGKFWFSIRRKRGAEVDIDNAWLFFEDLFAYGGTFYRSGLDWRFNWKDRSTGKKYSLIIKRGGEGYYYDWSLASGDGQMSVSQTAFCKPQQIKN